MLLMDFFRTSTCKRLMCSLLSDGSSSPDKSWNSGWRKELITDYHWACRNCVKLEIVRYTSAQLNEQQSLPVVVCKWCEWRGNNKTSQLAVISTFVWRGKRRRKKYFSFTLEPLRSEAFFQLYLRSQTVTLGSASSLRVSLKLKFVSFRGWKSQ